MIFLKNLGVHSELDRRRFLKKLRFKKTLISLFFTLFSTSTVINILTTIFAFKQNQINFDLQFIKIHIHSYVHIIQQLFDVC